MRISCLDDIALQLFHCVIRIAQVVWTLLICTASCMQSESLDTSLSSLHACECHEVLCPSVVSRSSVPSSLTMAAPMPLPSARGGIRIRAAAFVADERALFNRPSRLFEYLLEKFAWGHMSANMVREIAVHACEDNPSPPRDLKVSSVLF